MSSESIARTIRPGLPAYLPLGIVVAGVIAIWIGVWIGRGPQTGAWKPILLFGAVYVVWVMVVRARVVRITAEGMTCIYLMRPPKTVAWSEITQSPVTYLMRRVPTQILVYGERIDAPLVTISLGLYSKRDVKYLMALEDLKVIT